MSVRRRPNCWTLCWSVGRRRGQWASGRNVRATSSKRLQVTVFVVVCSCCGFFVFVGFVLVCVFCCFVLALVFVFILVCVVFLL